MLRRFAFLFLMVAIGNCFTVAQWKRSVEGGIGVKFGIGNSAGGGSTNLYSNDINTLQYNLGKGMQYQIATTWKKDSNVFSYSCGIFWSRTPAVHYAGQFNPTKPSHYAYLKNEQLGMLLQFGVPYSILNCTNESSFGLQIPLFMRSTEEEVMQSDTLKFSAFRNIYYKKTVGAFIQHRIYILNQSSFQFYVQGTANFMSGYREKSVLYAYQDNKNQTLEAIYPNIAYRETQYLSDAEIAKVGKLNNSKTNASGFNPALPTQTFAYSEPFSYWMLQVGIRFSLH